MAENDIPALQALIERSQEPITWADGGDPFVVVRSDSKIEVLSKLLGRPSRKIGAPQFTNAASFIDYVNEQKIPETRLYVTCPTNIVAIINHHEPSPNQESVGRAGWGDNRASLTLTQTPEWALWKSKDRSSMSQRDFAQFIEDNADDIAAPTGASLLELIRTIKTSQQLELTGEMDEKNDARATSFVLAAKTKAGAKQEVDLPGEFVLSLSPYEGGRLIGVRARLRVQISAPRFTLNYEILNMARIERAALKDIAEAVAAGVELSAWFGTP